MCSPFVRKEANRLNWLIKGKLIDRSWSDQEVERTYDSYFKRLWGNNWGNNERAQYGATGFEAAYKAREAEILSEEMKSVANLGYD